LIVSSLRRLGLLVLCLCVFDMAWASPVRDVDPDVMRLIHQCAPTVHPETMTAVIVTESRGRQFAVADAGPVKLPWTQRKYLVRSFNFDTADLAVEKATELIKNGHTVSLGLSQINDRNLRGLNLSVRDVFDTCTNIAAGAYILTNFYKKATAKFGENTKALRAALSAYNSGNWIRGEQDGYVDIVYRNAGIPVPGFKAKEKNLSIKLLVSDKKQVLSKSFAMTSNHFVVGE
jgi:type IV secretion system protein VirB1